MKKYFTFSDVHGEYTVLIASLEKVGFDPDNDEHILICLGDSFDRGIQNAEVLEFLLEYHNKKRLKLVKGNHDGFLIDFLTGQDDGIFNFQYNGMAETLDDLSGLDTQKYIKRMPHLIRDKIKENYPDLIKLFNTAVVKLELGNYIFLHAGYTITNKYNNWEDNEWEPDIWARTDDFFEAFHHSPNYQGHVKYVVGHWHAFRLRQNFEGFTYDETGHITLKDHSIFRHRNYIAIDACTNLSKTVNILVLTEDELYV